MTDAQTGYNPICSEVWEGTSSKFISQIKRQRRAGCISFVRLCHTQMAELLWESPNECHTGLFDTGRKLWMKKGTQKFDRDVLTRALLRCEKYTLLFHIFGLKKNQKTFWVENLKTKKHWLDNNRLGRCITLQAISRHNAIHVMYNMQDLKK